MAFPTTPTDGQVSTINGISYTYTELTNSWKRNQTSLPSLSLKVDTFVGDGSTTAFSLSTTPASKDLVTVNIDGVSQLGSAFNVTGSTLTLTGTPVDGAVIEVKTVAASPMGVVTGLVLDTFTGNGSTTEYTLSTTPISASYTIVHVGGTVKNKSEYSISGKVLTFTVAPSNSAKIEVTTFNPVNPGSEGTTAIHPFFLTGM